MNTGGIIAIVVILLLIAAAVGWVLFTRLRAQRLGLPAPSLSSYIPFRKSSAPPYGPPQPAPGGVVGWFNDRVRMFKNRNNRTAAGAYEQPLTGGGGGSARGRRGFGPLDPDEAWDSRVGNEADSYGPGGYYEEQELGNAPRHLGVETAYSGGDSGGSYSMNLAATPGVAPAGFGDDEEGGRGRTRSRSPGGPPRPNPFDDDAEPSNMSLRGVSPRPIDPAEANTKGSGNPPQESPTERRSIFREAV